MTIAEQNFVYKFINEEATTEYEQILLCANHIVTIRLPNHSFIHTQVELHNGVGK